VVRCGGPFLVKEMINIESALAWTCWDVNTQNWASNRAMHGKLNQKRVWRHEWAYTRRQRLVWLPPLQLPPQAVKGPQEWPPGRKKMSPHSKVLANCRAASTLARRCCCLVCQPLSQPRQPMQSTQSRSPRPSRRSCSTFSGQIWGLRWAPRRWPSFAERAASGQR